MARRKKHVDRRSATTRDKRTGQAVSLLASSQITRKERGHPGQQVKRDASGERENRQCTSILSRPPPSCVAWSVHAGISIALFLLALTILAVVFVELIRVEDEDNADNASSWHKRSIAWRAKIANAVPLTSIKIVVVAWQIITQVNDFIKPWDGIPVTLDAKDCCCVDLQCVNICLVGCASQTLSVTLRRHEVRISTRERRASAAARHSLETTTLSEGLG